MLLRGQIIAAGCSGSLMFTDYSHAVFSYTVDGVTGSKTIERQPF